MKLGSRRVAGPLTAPPSFLSSSRCAGELTSAQPDRKGNYADREKSYFLLSFVSFFFFIPFNVLKEKMTHEEVNKIFQ